jgi:FlaA1/EpsC-like NDP-sugar epimerase
MPADVEGLRPSHRDAYFRRTLGLSDVFAALVAVIVGLQVLGDDRLKAGALLAFPFVVLVSKVAGLYDRDELLLNKTTLDEVPALFGVATLYALVIWLLEERVVSGHLGDRQVIGLWGLLFMFMTLGRWTVRRLLGSVLTPERCLVVGGPLEAQRIARKLEKTHAVSARIVGRVPFEPETSDLNGDLPVVASLDELGLAIAAHEVDRVVIAPGTTDQDTILDVIRLVKALGVKVSVLPRLFEVVGSSVEFDTVEGFTLLGVRRFGLTKSSRLLKRGMDIVGAALGLLILSPLFVLVALATKLTSQGPVLFQQPASGRAAGSSGCSSSAR